MYINTYRFWMKNNMMMEERSNVKLISGPDSILLIFDLPTD